jgi:hypothetical protein
VDLRELLAKEKAAGRAGDLPSIFKQISQFLLEDNNLDTKGIWQVRWAKCRLRHTHSCREIF